MDSEAKVINVYTLRIVVGALAFLLPVVVVIGVPVLCGEAGIGDSISGYYHTIMRNYFVGTLCAVAIILFSYKGYPGSNDDLLGDIAAVFAIMVAFFPATPDCLPDICIDTFCKQEFYGIVHNVAAISLFGILGYFSLFLFTKPNDESGKSPQKKKRDQVYRWCGWIIFGSMFLVLVYFLIIQFGNEDLGDKFSTFKPIFVFEFVMLWAFGISWLVKGEIILKDSDEENDA